MFIKVKYLFWFTIIYSDVRYASLLTVLELASDSSLNTGRGKQGKDKAAPQRPMGILLVALFPGPPQLSLFGMGIENSTAVSAPRGPGAVEPGPPTSSHRPHGLP